MTGIARFPKMTEACRALIASRVRVKDSNEVGTVATVCADKLGEAYQVHVKLDDDDSGQVTIFSPGDLEPEQLS